MAAPLDAEIRAVIDGTAKADVLAVLLEGLTDAVLDAVRLDWIDGSYPPQLCLKIRSSGLRRPNPSPLAGEER